MFRRYFFALAAIAFATTAISQQAVHHNTYHWIDAETGGYSGVEVSADGNTLWAITDRGLFTSGTLERNESGAIISVTNVETRPVMFFDLGVPLNKPHSDIEGLAVSSTGEKFISFEQIPRVRGLHETRIATTWIPEHPDLWELKPNAALEALAIDDNGALYMLPERSGALNRPFPVYRVKDRKWDIPFHIPRRDKLLPVGADFGPDGRLYLLERAFLGFWGFRTRVRAFTIIEDRIAEETVVLETNKSIHDNLEGLSVWRDKTGALRLTMISDNNFNFLQRTEIVEYRIQQ